jgi:hypothetical protein
MIEITGDFWKHSNDYFAIVCTTNTTLKNNGELVMGKGIAKGFAEHYPALPKLWGDKVKSGHIDVMISDFCGSDGNYEPMCIALPTKRSWKICSSEPLVIRSCWEMLNILKYIVRFKEGNGKILMTRPGCGNGGLKWEDIKPKINFLDDRFVVISND